MSVQNAVVDDFTSQTVLLSISSFSMKHETGVYVTTGREPFSLLLYLLNVEMLMNET